MDQVTKVRKQLKLEQWKALIAECMASGMTVTSVTVNALTSWTQFFKNVHAKITSALTISSAALRILFMRCTQAI